ncbi:ABC transporter permease [Lacticaseibacillus rhamnosus]|uniref:ABC transporter permease n=1 Tax=Lacticaseibacillus rhamnosus TaxID=47715 RepID=UPI0004065846|nr:FtsX-like permease family protein [Lacticaseibacillus rhamnosus]
MHAGNILGKQVSVNGTNYDIASIYEGVVETPDVLMSRQAYLMTRGLKDQSNRIKVTYRSSRLRTERAVMNYLNKYGDNSSMGRYQLLNVQQIVSQLNRNTSLATNLIAGVAGISLIVAGFGIMGSTYSSIAERKNEIGLRRAFGAKRKDIRNQFMAEGLLMTITASIISVVLVKAASLMLGRSLGIAIIITWNNMLVAVLIPNIIGMIFTFFPAMSASKKNVLDLLR